MGVVGNPVKFHKKFSFVVEIEDVDLADFTKCSDLEAEIAKVEQWQGGTLIPDKSPGRVTISDITLERGVADGDSDLYSWWLDVVRVSANQGLPTAGYKRPVGIITLDRDATILRRWPLDNCWPTKMVVGQWDNEADENQVESLTFTFDSFDLIEGG